MKKERRWNILMTQKTDSFLKQCLLKANLLVHRFLGIAYNKFINGFHETTQIPPQIPYTWNCATDLVRLHTQLQNTLKGALMLVFSINYSECHHGQLASVNWIWRATWEPYSLNVLGNWNEQKDWPGQKTEDSSGKKQ